MTTVALIVAFIFGVCFILVIIALHKSVKLVEEDYEDWPPHQRNDDEK